MKRFKQKIGNFNDLSIAEKLGVPLVLFMLGISRAIMVLLPFRYYSKYLGRYCEVKIFTPLLSESQIQSARRISYLIQATAKITPWKSQCLVQAMTASVIFKYRKIPYVLFFGLAKSRFSVEEKPMSAHAWLTAGPVFVTGQKSLDEFTVVATYASETLQEAICSG